LTTARVISGSSPKNKFEHPSSVIDRNLTVNEKGYQNLKVIIDKDFNYIYEKYQNLNNGANMTFRKEDLLMSWVALNMVKNRLFFNLLRLYALIEGILLILLIFYR
jgi:hypothetical protein